MERQKCGFLTIRDETYSVYDGVNIIGRAKPATILLSNPGVDHLQAVLNVVSGSQGHFISDLSSERGTYVDGKRLVPYKLYEIPDGSAVLFGEDIKATYSKVTDAEINLSKACEETEELKREVNALDASDEIEVIENVVETEIIPLNSCEKTQNEIDIAVTHLSTCEEMGEAVKEDNVDTTLPNEETEKSTDIEITTFKDCEEKEETQKEEEIEIIPVTACEVTEPKVELEITPLKTCEEPQETPKEVELELTPENSCEEKENAFEDVEVEITPSTSCEEKTIEEINIEAATIQEIEEPQNETTILSTCEESKEILPLKACEETEDTQENEEITSPEETQNEVEVELTPCEETQKENDVERTTLKASEEREETQTEADIEMAPCDEIEEAHTETENKLKDCEDLEETQNNTVVNVNIEETQNNTVKEVDVEQTQKEVDDEITTVKTCEEKEETQTNVEIEITPAETAEETEKEAEIDVANFITTEEREEPQVEAEIKVTPSEESEDAPNEVEIEVRNSKTSVEIEEDIETHVEESEDIEETQKEVDIEITTSKTEEETLTEVEIEVTPLNMCEESEVMENKIEISEETQTEAEIEATSLNICVESEETQKEADIQIQTCEEMQKEVNIETTSIKMLEEETDKEVDIEITLDTSEEMEQTQRREDDIETTLVKECEDIEEVHKEEVIKHFEEAEETQKGEDVEIPSSEETAESSKAIETCEESANVSIEIDTNNTKNEPSIVTDCENVASDLIQESENISNDSIPISAVIIEETQITVEESGINQLDSSILVTSPIEMATDTNIEVITSPILETNEDITIAEEMNNEAQSEIEQEDLKPAEELSATIEEPTQIDDSVVSTISEVDVIEDSPQESPSCSDDIIPLAGENLSSAEENVNIEEINTSELPLQTEDADSETISSIEETVAVEEANTPEVQPHSGEIISSIDENEPEEANTPELQKSETISPTEEEEVAVEEANTSDSEPFELQLSCEETEYETISPIDETVPVEEANASELQSPPSEIPSSIEENIMEEANTPEVQLPAEESSIEEIVVEEVNTPEVQPPSEIVSSIEEDNVMDEAKISELPAEETESINISSTEETVAEEEVNASEVQAPPDENISSNEESIIMEEGNIPELPLPIEETNKILLIEETVAIEEENTSELQTPPGSIPTEDTESKTITSIEETTAEEESEVQHSPSEIISSVDEENIMEEASRIELQLPTEDTESKTISSIEETVALEKVIISEVQSPLDENISSNEESIIMDEDNIQELPLPIEETEKKLLIEDTVAKEEENASELQASTSEIISSIEEEIIPEESELQCPTEETESKISSIEETVTVEETITPELQTAPSENMSSIEENPTIEEEVPLPSEETESSIEETIVVEEAHTKVLQPAPSNEENIIMEELQLPAEETESKTVASIEEIVTVEEANSSEFQSENLSYIGEESVIMEETNSSDLQTPIEETESKTDPIEETKISELQTRIKESELKTDPIEETKISELQTPIEDSELKTNPIEETKTSELITAEETEAKTVEIEEANASGIETSEKEETELKPNSGLSLILSCYGSESDEEEDSVNANAEECGFEVIEQAKEEVSALDEISEPNSISKSVEVLEDNTEMPMDDSPMNSITNKDSDFVIIPQDSSETVEVKPAEEILCESKDDSLSNDFVIVPSEVNDQPVLAKTLGESEKLTLLSELQEVGVESESLEEIASDTADVDKTESDLVTSDSLDILESPCLDTDKSTILESATDISDSGICEKVDANESTSSEKDSVELENTENVEIKETGECKIIQLLEDAIGTSAESKEAEIRDSKFSEDSNKFAENSDNIELGCLDNSENISINTHSDESLLSHSADVKVDELVNENELAVASNSLDETINKSHVDENSGDNIDIQEPSVLAVGDLTETQSSLIETENISDETHLKSISETHSNIDESIPETNETLSKTEENVSQGLIEGTIVTNTTEAVAEEPLSMENDEEFEEMLKPTQNFEEKRESALNSTELKLGSEIEESIEVISESDTTENYMITDCSVANVENMNTLENIVETSENMDVKIEDVTNKNELPLPVENSDHVTDKVQTVISEELISEVPTLEPEQESVSANSQSIEVIEEELSSENTVKDTSNDYETTTIEIDNTKPSTFNSGEDLEASKSCPVIFNKLEESTQSILEVPKTDEKTSASLEEVTKSTEEEEEEQSPIKSLESKETSDDILIDSKDNYLDTTTTSVEDEVTVELINDTKDFTETINAEENRKSMTIENDLLDEDKISEKNVETTIITATKEILADDTSKTKIDDISNEKSVEEIITNEQSCSENQADINDDVLIISVESSEELEIHESCEELQKTTDTLEEPQSIPEVIDKLESAQTIQEIDDLREEPQDNTDINIVPTEIQAMQEIDDKSEEATQETDETLVEDNYSESAQLKEETENPLCIVEPIAIDIASTSAIIIEPGKEDMEIAKLEVTQIDQEEETSAKIDTEIASTNIELSTESVELTEKDELMEGHITEEQTVSAEIDASVQNIEIASTPALSIEPSSDNTVLTGDDESVEGSTNLEVAQIDQNEEIRVSAEIISSIREDIEIASTSARNIELDTENTEVTSEPVEVATTLEVELNEKEIVSTEIAEETGSYITLSNVNVEASEVRQLSEDKNVLTEEIAVVESVPEIVNDESKVEQQIKEPQIIDETLFNEKNEQGTQEDLKQPDDSIAEIENEIITAEPEKSDTEITNETNNLEDKEQMDEKIDVSANDTSKDVELEEMKPCTSLESSEIVAVNVDLLKEEQVCEKEEITLNETKSKAIEGNGAIPLESSSNPDGVEIVQETEVVPKDQLESTDDVIAETSLIEEECKETTKQVMENISCELPSEETSNSNDMPEALHEIKETPEVTENEAKEETVLGDNEICSKSVSVELDNLKEHADETKEDEVEIPTIDENKEITIDNEDLSNKSSLEDVHEMQENSTQIQTDEESKETALNDESSAKDVELEEDVLDIKEDGIEVLTEVANQETTLDITVQSNEQPASEPTQNEIDLLEIKEDVTKTSLTNETDINKPSTSSNLSSLEPKDEQDSTAETMEEEIKSPVIEEHKEVEPTTNPETIPKEYDVNKMEGELKTNENTIVNEMETTSISSNKETIINDTEMISETEEFKNSTPAPEEIHLQEAVSEKKEDEANVLEEKTIIVSQPSSSESVLTTTITEDVLDKNEVVTSEETIAIEENRSTSSPSSKVVAEVASTDNPQEIVLEEEVTEIIEQPALIDKSNKTSTSEIVLETLPVNDTTVDISIETSDEQSVPSVNEKPEEIVENKVAVELDEESMEKLDENQLSETEKPQGTEEKESTVLEEDEEPTSSITKDEINKQELIIETSTTDDSNSVIDNKPILDEEISETTADIKDANDEKAEDATPEKEEPPKNDVELVSKEECSESVIELTPESKNDENDKAKEPQTTEIAETSKQDIELVSNDKETLSIEDTHLEECIENGESTNGSFQDENASKMVEDITNADSLEKVNASAILEDKKDNLEQVEKDACFIVDELKPENTTSEIMTNECENVKEEIAVDVEERPKEILEELKDRKESSVINADSGVLESVPKEESVLSEVTEISVTEEVAKTDLKQCNEIASSSVFETIQDDVENDEEITLQEETRKTEDEEVKPKEETRKTEDEEVKAKEETRTNENEEVKLKDETRKDENEEVKPKEESRKNENEEVKLKDETRKDANEEVKPKDETGKPEVESVAEGTNKQREEVINMPTLETVAIDDITETSESVAIKGEVIADSSESKCSELKDNEQVTKEVAETSKLPEGNMQELVENKDEATIVVIDDSEESTKEESCEKRAEDSLEKATSILQETPQKDTLETVVAINQATNNEKKKSTEESSNDVLDKEGSNIVPSGIDTEILNKSEIPHKDTEILKESDISEVPLKDTLQTVVVNETTICDNKESAVETSKEEPVAGDSNEDLLPKDIQDSDLHSNKSDDKEASTSEIKAKLSEKLNEEIMKFSESISDQGKVLPGDEIKPGEKEEVEIVNAQDISGTIVDLTNEDKCEITETCDKAASISNKEDTKEAVNTEVKHDIKPSEVEDNNSSDKNEVKITPGKIKLVALKTLMENASVQLNETTGEISNKKEILKDAVKLEDKVNRKRHLSAEHDEQKEDSKDNISASNADDESECKAETVSKLKNALGGYDSESKADANYFKKRKLNDEAKTTEETFKNIKLELLKQSQKSPRRTSESEAFLSDPYPESKRSRFKPRRRYIEDDGSTSSDFFEDVRPKRKKRMRIKKSSAKAKNEKVYVVKENVIADDLNKLKIALFSEDDDSKRRFSEDSTSTQGSVKDSPGQTINKLKLKITRNMKEIYKIEEKLEKNKALAAKHASTSDMDYSKGYIKPSRFKTHSLKRSILKANDCEDKDSSNSDDDELSLAALKVMSGGLSKKVKDDETETPKTLTPSSQKLYSSQDTEESASEIDSVSSKKSGEISFIPLQQKYIQNSIAELESLKEKRKRVSFGRVLDLEGDKKDTVENQMELMFVGQGGIDSFKKVISEDEEKSKQTKAGVVKTRRNSKLSSEPDEKKPTKTLKSRIIKRCTDDETKPEPYTNKLSDDIKSDIEIINNAKLLSEAQSEKNADGIPDDPVPHCSNTLGNQEVETNRRPIRIRKKKFECLDEETMTVPIKKRYVKPKHFTDKAKEDTPKKQSPARKGRGKKGSSVEPQPSVSTVTPAPILEDEEDKLIIKEVNDVLKKRWSGGSDSDDESLISLVTAKKPRRTTISEGSGDDKGTPKPKPQPQPVQQQPQPQLQPQQQQPSEVLASPTRKANLGVNFGFSSPTERIRRKCATKVAFTMLHSPELETLVRTLGGKVVDSVDDSTVLVTNNVFRTQKLLMAVGQCKPVCSPEWLRECKKENTFLDPWNFLLIDGDAEIKWNFSIEESYKRSKAKKLFQGYSFYVMSTLAEEVLKGAIESCGGKIVSKMSKNTNFVVVASEENRPKCIKYFKQNVKVVLPEAIFDGVLRQEIVFDNHLLT